MYLVTAWQMRQMDKKTIEEYGIPGMVLMENAGRGATRVLLSLFGDLKDKKIGILAGRGNNGGDGFVIARYLVHRGIDVTVYLLSEASAIKGDAKANLNLLSVLGVPVIDICDQKTLLKHKTAMTHRDIWVDSIFGTGLNTDIKGFLKSLIEFINKLEKPVLSVDIPSGLHPDTGQALGICVKASVTVTFAFAKTGHMTYPGVDYCGRIEIVDIGIPPHIVQEALPYIRLLTPEMVSSYYKKRNGDSHKGETGHLLVAAGSKGKTGAAALTSLSAMRSGAGLVTLGVPKRLSSVVETLLIEVMTLPLPETKNGALSASALEPLKEALSGKVCMAIGPGLGLNSQTVSLVRELVVQSEVPVVMDADALNSLEGDTNILRNMNAPAVLTPHPKEMARLIGSSVDYVQKNRIKCTADFAEKFKVHVVLKGARTVIAHPDGRVFINPGGNAAMASGGMGDVLTGMIAGFITQGYSPEQAVHLGVYLHGEAGDLLAKVKGPFGIIASDIIDVLPEIIGHMAEGKLEALKNIGHWF